MSAVYCICKQSDSGIMIECIRGTGGCNGWVHPSCCQLLLTQAELEALEGYICPMCEESNDDYSKLNAVNTEIANRRALKERKKRQIDDEEKRKKVKRAKREIIPEDDDDDDEEQEFEIKNYEARDTRLMIKDDDDKDEEEDEDEQEIIYDDDDETPSKERESTNITEQPILMVVERILASRAVKLTIAENSKYDYEYLIKWKGYSYMHASWESVETLLRLDPINKQRIKRFDEKKYSQHRPTTDKTDGDGNVEEEEEEEYFNPDFLDVHRIIEERREKLPPNTKTEDGKIDNGIRYLVKWSQLPYNECTWERACDIADENEALEKFYQRNEIPPKEEWEVNTRHYPPSIKEYRKLDKSPEYGHNEALYLREYQLEGLNWLMWNWYNQRSSILADEMGLGKTIQTLAFLDRLWKNPKIRCRGPFIIIAPLSLISQWQNECEIWTDMNCIVYHGNNEARQYIKEYEFFYDQNTKSSKKSKKPNLYKFHILVTTYEIAIKDINLFSKIHWRCMIVDEAHRLKNQRSRLVDQLRTIKRDHCILLTGTPLQNKTEELWALLNFIDAKNFPTISTFLSQFGDLHDSKQVASLHKMLKPYILRRVKEDVEKSLPPKEETIIEVELTSIQKKWYKAIYEKNTAYLLKGNQSQNIPNLMNIMMELRKCCNHPYLNNGVEEILTENITTEAEKYQILVKCCGKMVLLDKLLPRLKENGHKILIFSQMVRVLDILEDYITYKGYLYERLDGNIRGHDRQAAVNRFIKKEYNRFIMLLSTKAGGLGLNLTAADTVIIFDSDWNPQNDLQAQARAHRIGQTHAVKIYRLITKKTYEMEMFHRASLKLGLDRAVLTHMRKENDSQNTKRNKLEEAKEINELLKKGAYNVFRQQNTDNEEDKDAEEFCSADIDEILQRSTQVITYDNEKKSNFSKASFISAATSDDVDLDDPDFWKKAIGLKEPENMNEYGENNDLVIEGQRRRTRVTRFGITAEGDMEDDDVEINENSADEKEGDDKENNKKESIQRDWTANGRDRLQRALMHYGYGRWSIIRNQSGGSRTLQEIELCSRIFILHCAICCTEGLLVTSNQNNNSMGAIVPSASGNPLDYEGARSEENLFIRSSVHVAQRIKQNEQYYQYYIDNLPAVLKEDDFIAKLKANGAKRFLIRLDMLNRLQTIISKACIKLRQEEEELKKRPSVTLASNANEAETEATEPNHVESQPENTIPSIANLDECIEYFGIKKSCNAIEIIDIGERPSWTMIASWWNYECDRNLLLGVFLHGYGRVQQILADPNLCFQEKLQQYQAESEERNGKNNDDTQMPEVQQINRLLGWLLSAEDIRRGKEEEDHKKEQLINDQKRQRTIEIKQRQAKIWLKKKQYYKEIAIEALYHEVQLQTAYARRWNGGLSASTSPIIQKAKWTFQEKKAFCYYTLKFGSPEDEGDLLRLKKFGLESKTMKQLADYYGLFYRPKLDDIRRQTFDVLDRVADCPVDFVDGEEPISRHSTKAFFVAALSHWSINFIGILRKILDDVNINFLDHVKRSTIRRPAIWWIPIVHDVGLMEGILKHGIQADWRKLQCDTDLPFTREAIDRCLQLVLPFGVTKEERGNLISFPKMLGTVNRLVNLCNSFIHDENTLKELTAEDMTGWLEYDGNDDAEADLEHCYKQWKLTEDDILRKLCAMNTDAIEF